MKLGVTAVMLPELDFDEQIALCKKLRVTCYQYRPRYINAEQRDKPFGFWGNHKFDLTPERLIAEGAAMTRELRENGLEPFGTVPAVTVDAPDEMIAQHVRGASVASAGRIRCNPPAPPSKIFDYRKYLEQTIARYTHAVEKIARPQGIKLVIETHSRTAACSPALAWNIVRHFSPRDLGVILDIANFNIEGEVKAHLAVSVLRDFIDCVHIGGFRRTRGGRDEFGCEKIEYAACSLEDSDSYMPEWIGALKEADVQAPLIVEDYEQGVSSEVRLGRCARVLERLLRK